MGYVNALQQTAKEAVDFIKTAVKTKPHIILTEENMDEDAFYEAPSIGYVTKHGYYLCYHIAEIYTNEDGRVEVKAFEAEDRDEMFFNLEELDIDVICTLADAMNN